VEIRARAYRDLSQRCESIQLEKKGTEAGDYQNRVKKNIEEKEGGKVDPRREEILTRCLGAKRTRRHKSHATKKRAARDAREGDEKNS